MTETRPKHYRGKTLEVIDVIRDFELDFETGNVLKYLLRAGRKPGEDARADLLKAVQYLLFKLQLPDLGDVEGMKLVVDLAESLCRVEDRFPKRDEMVLALRAIGKAEFL